MNQIYENSIYADEASKKEFLADKQRVIDAFLINFLGQVVSARQEGQTGRFAEGRR